MNVLLSCAGHSTQGQWPVSGFSCQGQPVLVPSASVYGLGTWTDEFGAQLSVPGGRRSVVGFSASVPGLRTQDSVACARGRGQGPVPGGEVRSPKSLTVALRNRHLVHMQVHPVHVLSANLHPFIIHKNNNICCMGAHGAHAMDF